MANPTITSTDVTAMHDSQAISASTSLFGAATATAAGGVGMAWQALASTGLTWQTVPALLFGGASMLTAVFSGIRLRQELRHREERHRLDLRIRERESGLG